MKAYKVKYTLNESAFWTVAPGETAEDAAEKVYKQISEAYPDDDYEYVDVESDFDDGGVHEDDSFIEGGNEYIFIARVGDVVHLDFDNWAVWAARDVDTNEINFFIVDEDTGFIDWGPVDSAQEATEFLQSKITDWENEDDNIDDLEYPMFESKGSISALEQELVSTVQKVMTSPEFGFDEEEAKAYSAVEVKRESDSVKVEVRAEVSYDDMWTIKDACDPIVMKYDSEAYFDFEQPGILNAYIDAKNLTEDIDVVSEEPTAAPIEEGPQVGLSSVINSLIVDEYEAIEGYTSAIATARSEGYEDVAKVLEDISAEESVHVGQLQELMKIFDPGAVRVKEGQEEAEKQLSDERPEVASEPQEINEDVEESDSELETAEQKISSANTSINSTKLPAIFSMVRFAPNTLNLDYGGGKFDNAAEFLSGQGVTNLVYDPYNRSAKHNAEVLLAVRENGGADTVTISNVLNVIAEPEARLAVLRNAKRLVKPSGTVYITVYEGNKSGQGAETKSGYQLNRGTADYLEEIESVFDNVTRKGKLIVAK